MSSRVPLYLAALLLFAKPALHALDPDSPYNGLVLQAISAMPKEGGYSPTSGANRALRNAVLTSGDSLRIDPLHALPSYCSSATYLVFLSVLSQLQAEGRINAAPGTIASLVPSGQPDGTGIWGRWNANGPGTARLFYELGLGRNFTDLSAARPGDFMKIFWSDAIGSSEHGHSVIFLGYDPKTYSLTFWSSNIPGGYGKKSVPLRKIHRMIFSRLEHPSAISRELPRTDPYLASLQRRSSSAGEMARQCGLALTAP